MNQLRSIFSRPFPESDELGQNLREIAMISSFVAVIVWWLRPAGGALFEERAILQGLAFGVTTFVVSLAYFGLGRLIPGVRRNIPSWTFGKWLIYVMGLLLCIAWGNLLVVKLLYPGYELDLTAFLDMAQWTLLIGFLPVVGSGWWIWYSNNRKNIAAAASIGKSRKSTNPPETLTLQNAARTQQLQVPADRILYLESRQNYVTIRHLDAENTLTESTLRNTLKDLLTQLPEAEFFRCHQSYIVRLDRIEEVSGNAQGLRLTLRDGDENEVPVSRRYIAELRNRTA